MLSSKIVIAKLTAPLVVWTVYLYSLPSTHFNAISYFLLEILLLLGTLKTWSLLFPKATRNQKVAVGPPLPRSVSDNYRHSSSVPILVSQSTVTPPQK